jgi:hypothetical protein
VRDGLTDGGEQGGTMSRDAAMKTIEKLSNAQLRNTGSALLMGVHEFTCGFVPVAVVLHGKSDTYKRQGLLFYEQT